VALSVLATFVLGLSRLIPAILRIQQQVQNMRMSFPFGRSAAKLIAQIDTAASNQQESSSARSFLGKIGVLKLHKVSFSFEANVPILFDVCAEFRTNQSTVIVGASGAGKTTLIDIISGIRVPAKGNVTWSGVELNSLANTGELKIGYVSQDVKLFNGSLKENILMDRRQVTDEQYRQAIKICELDEIILRLEDGENTRLGDGQRLLSGGEIQRIGIARAIIVRPHILILDEFTSNLDMNAEKKILGNLLDNMKSDTIIISIAHRISAIKKFDRVIELSTGRIFFDGSTESWLKIHNKANL
jgi:ABC-type multidrug transport system fused ATPase/permease subunit